MTPDVSVVIPTFNREALIERAVQSALANEPEVSVEVVVVNDGSTDGTMGRLARFGDGVRVHSFPANRGRNHARNEGLRLATGGWVKFLDSDDVLEPGALKVEVGTGREAEADLVASACRIGGLSGGQTTIRREPDLSRGIDSILAGEAVPTSAALYRRSFVASFEWDTNLSKLDDWDYFVRVCLGGARCTTLPLVSYTWVAHEEQGIHRSSMYQNAIEHHAILRKIERRIEARGELTEARKQRLAQYFYKELRILSLHDRVAFDRAVAHIYELDPGFVPRDEERQRWMRVLARAFGFRRAVLLHTFVKTRVRGNEH